MNGNDISIWINADHLLRHNRTSLAFPPLVLFKLLLCHQVGHPADPGAAHVSAAAATDEQEENHPGDRA